MKEWSDLGITLLFILIYVGLMVVCAAGALFLNRMQKVLVQLHGLTKQLRELAAIYPPFPVVEDEDTGESKGQTSVQINPGWDEELTGRD